MTRVVNAQFKTPLRLELLHGECKEVGHEANLSARGQSQSKNKHLLSTRHLRSVSPLGLIIRCTRHVELEQVGVFVPLRALSCSLRHLSRQLDSTLGLHPFLGCNSKNSRDRVSFTSLALLPALSSVNRCYSRSILRYQATRCPDNCAVESRCSRLCVHSCANGEC